MMSNMQKLLEQAQKLQDDMENIQNRLKNEEIEGSAGGGTVVFKITGASEFKAFEIDEHFLKNNDKKTIENAILAAAQAAITKARDVHRQQMENVTSNLKLPGFPGLS